MGSQMSSCCRTLVAAAFAAATYPISLVHAAVLPLDTVVVGNAGNLPDPLTGLGSVGYSYHITNTEVTNGQYAAFLNRIDPTGSNPHDLYNPDMTNATGFAVVKGGINFDPQAAPGTMYSPKPN